MSEVDLTSTSPRCSKPRITLMSFQMQIDERSAQAARLIMRVHREIQKAFSSSAKEGMTQQALATKLEVNRATVNRRLQGLENMTLRTISDMAWALDCELEEIRFRSRKDVSGNGQAIEDSPAPVLQATSAASASGAKYLAKGVAAASSGNLRRLEVAQ
ncbi:MAG: helix-turn-helix domain-containing protein [Hyphomicrobiales bacterium]|nr:MAG: helix-turn-helix domain-containing protein [Hyphomicrobiales bacterium]